MATAIEEKRDYQALVTGEVIERKYIPVAKLKYLNQEDEWPVTVIEDEFLGITEEDGVIIIKTGKARMDLGTGDYAQVRRDQYGREIPAADQRDIPANVLARMPIFKVWDFRITEVTETDGPAQKKRLMETYEGQKQRMAEEHAAEQATQLSLADAVSKLADKVSVPEPEPAKAGRGK
tara:strand:- start:213 stop:746 length:534 start_codon:yes stop_codon:yes gene_type:complete